MLMVKYGLEKSINMILKKKSLVSTYSYICRGAFAKVVKGNALGTGKVVAIKICAKYYIILTIGKKWMKTNPSLYKKKYIS
jgi:hypothetical protein